MPVYDQWYHAECCQPQLQGVSCVANSRTARDKLPRRENRHLKVMRVAHVTFAVSVRELQCTILLQEYKVLETWYQSKKVASDRDPAHTSVQMCIRPCMFVRLVLG